MRPSRRLLILVALWAVLGLLLAIVRLVGWPVVSVLAVVFWTFFAVVAVIASMDYFSLRVRPELEVKRWLPPHLALGVRQGINIRISNTSSRQYRMSVTDMPGNQLNYQDLPVFITLAPGEYAEIRYHVFPIQRGLVEFAPLNCRIRSPWSLWERTYAYGGPAQSKIYPNYKPLFRSSFINSEQLVNDMGIQLSQRRGEGTDFRQLREFRSGDSLRQIDWRATARFHKPISREYQEERDQQVIFMLDCGRRMRAKEDHISHFDHALNALLISAFIALRQGDSVGLMSYAGQPRWVPPVKGRQQISHLLEQVYDLHSSLETTDYIEAAQQLTARYRKRSLVILISSLEPEDRDDLSKAVSLLSRFHLVMVANMRQQVIEQAQRTEIHSIDDALSLCGATGHQQKQSAMLAQLRSEQVIVTDTLPSKMHAALISEYMVLKRGGFF
jgi:uncharacterized protein (DUF58 family)